MPEQWDQIKGLGSVGIEPDLNEQARVPQSLDIGRNVRAVGDHLANAGGFAMLSEVPEGILPPAVVPGPEASACISNIPPDEHLRLIKENGEYCVNRHFSYDWNDKENYLVALPVNYAGETYDWTSRQSKNGLDARNISVEGYLRGTRIRILNSGGQHRVFIESMNWDDTVQTEHLNYDATTEFTSGDLYWVIINYKRQAEQYDVYLTGPANSVQLQTGVWAAGALDNIEFIHQFTLSNYSGTEWLPLPVWKYNPAVWSCLTSSDFASLGGLPTLDKNPIYRIDPALTAADHKIKWENMIAMGLEPGANYKVAYYDLPESRFTGKKYWEFATIANQIEGDSKYYRGLADGQINDEELGLFLQSTGLERAGAALNINAVGQGVSVGFNAVVLFACDFDTGDLWIGELRDVAMHNPGGTAGWYGDVDPSQPASFNIYTPGSFGLPYKPQIALGRYEPRSRVELFANADGCTLTPPTGFDYLSL